MKFLMCVVVIFTIFFANLFVVNEAALAHAIYKNSDYPGKCTIDENLILSPGQSAKAPNNPCAIIKCMENGHAEFRTCAAVAPPTGCKQRDFIDIKRPYPQCCERAYDCTREIE